MSREGTGDDWVEGEVRHLRSLRQGFWDRVKAQDRAEAQRIRREIYDYPQRVDFDTNEYPVISRALSEALGDVDLDLSFIDKSDTPPEVWEAKAEIERLGRVIEAHGAGFNPEGEWKVAWDAVGTAHNALTTYFAALDPKLRRHPVLLAAMSDSRHGLFVQSGPMPALSEEERADLKRRRLYQWTKERYTTLFVAELSPVSDEAAQEWLENELVTEQRIKDLIASAGERFVSLYWVFEEDRLALIVTYEIGSGRGLRDVTSKLVSSGLFTIDRTTRILTSEQLWFGNAPRFPYSDSFREEDLDEEELAAFRQFRQREEAEKQAILASTPCHVCGRFVNPAETHAISSMPKETAIEGEDGEVEAEGPGVFGYCSEHMN